MVIICQTRTSSHSDIDNSPLIGCLEIEDISKRRYVWVSSFLILKRKKQIDWPSELCFPCFRSTITARPSYRSSDLNHFISFERCSAITTCPLPIVWALSPGSISSVATCCNCCNWCQSWRTSKTRYQLCISSYVTIPIWLTDYKQNARGRSMIPFPG